MADLVPSGAQPPSLIDPLRNPAGGPMLTRIGSFTDQPAVKKALPWFAGLAGVGLLALTWAVMAPAPQRMLYSSLSDGERAAVVESLDTAGITYAIDNSTGALSVGEDDLYRARMLVASEGSLAAPETGAQMLDSLPMGASRTLEGDRLRAAQERELTLTIMEIDSVESVRVHLAKPERSVFVRDNVPPTASVMVRMARGRQLADTQVTAIANLVAASVPGLSIDAVRIIDQNGRLLLQAKPGEADRIDLQARMEDKLRAQVEQLLSPMIGAGNFSSEIQVELDMAEVTSARESYDKDGAVRRETTQESQAAAAGTAAGIPGATSNTPPLDPQAVPGAPQGTPPAAQAGQGIGESSVSRTYELGREVAVSNQGPGTLKRLSVAVALNQDALKGAKPADIKKIEDLVAAAVGADPQRGDRVAVVTRPFAAVEAEEAPFWEAPWFAMVVRNAVALITVLLVLLLVVRPAIKALTGRSKKTQDEADEAPAQDGGGTAGALGFSSGSGSGSGADSAAGSELGKASLLQPGAGDLSEQIALAQRIVREQPDDALMALRRMIGDQPKMNEAA
jgi:flagellar M-ring protein FliF